MVFLNIGFGNLVSAQRIITILSPESSPIKRLIRLAKEKGDLIDASCGRKTQCVLVMDSGNVILSALGPETLLNKIYKNESESKP